MAFANLTTLAANFTLLVNCKLESEIQSNIITNLPKMVTTFDQNTHTMSTKVHTLTCTNSKL